MVFDLKKIKPIGKRYYANAPVYPDTTALKSSIFRGVDQTAVETLETHGFWSADGTGDLDRFNGQSA